MKTCLRVVGPISKVPLKYSRTLKTGSRLADKIKRIGREWIRSTENGCCIIECGLNSFYLLFLAIRRISFLSCLLYSGLYNTNIIL